MTIGWTPYISDRIPAGKQPVKTGRNPPANFRPDSGRKKPTGFNRSEYGRNTVGNERPEGSGGIPV